MDGAVTESNPLMRLPVWIRCSLILWFVIALVPMSFRLLGSQYLATPEWVSLVKIPSIVSGLAMATLFGWGIVAGLKANGNVAKIMTKLATFLLVLPIGFSIGSSFVTLGVPIVFTSIFGDPAEVNFRVSKFTPSVDRKCRNPITLNDLPWMFGKLCGFPEDFGRLVEVDGQVSVVGKSLGVGVFVKSAHKLD